MSESPLRPTPGLPHRLGNPGGTSVTVSDNLAASGAPGLFLEVEQAPGVRHSADLELSPAAAIDLAAALLDVATTNLRVIDLGGPLPQVSAAIDDHERIWTVEGDTGPGVHESEVFGRGGEALAAIRRRLALMDAASRLDGRHDADTISAAATYLQRLVSDAFPGGVLGRQEAEWRAAELLDALGAAEGDLERAGAHVAGE